MVHAATKLLDDFRALPSRVERPRTFMEIADYTRYEYVYNNLLAFYLDPREAHGFGTLMLDALMSFGRIAEADKVIGGDISVEQEVHTDRGKIDILITSDDHAILIEIKIYARVSNPFDDYATYLEHIADCRSKHKFLLTLYPSGEGNDWGFMNLTHEKFVGRIRSLLGHHVSGADARHLTMFLDFLNTLENLKKGTRMNKEFIELLAQRQEQVEHFLTDVEKLKVEMREKVRNLKNLIDVDKHRNITQLKPWLDPNVPYYDLPYDIHVSEDLVVQVETSIFPRGWHIWFWPSTGEYSELKDLLQRLGIPFEEYEEDGAFEHPDTFKHRYDENLDGISSLLQDLIDKIATSRRGRK